MANRNNYRDDGYRERIIEERRGGGFGFGAGLIIAILVMIVIVLLVYILGFSRQGGSQSPLFQIPSQIDVNINQTPNN